MGMQPPGTGRCCPLRAPCWQQPAGKPPLHAPGRGFVRKSGTAAPDPAPRADSAARGQELPLIASLLPPFINICPSTGQSEQNTPFGSGPLRSAGRPSASRPGNPSAGRWATIGLAGTFALTVPPTYVYGGKKIGPDEVALWWQRHLKQDEKGAGDTYAGGAKEAFLRLPK